jgi:transposase
MITRDDIQKMPLKTLQDACLSISRDYQVLQQELATLKRMIFGTKSERYLPSKDEAQQQSLFSESRKPEKEAASDQVIRYTRNQKTEKGHGRQILPSHLPREEVVIEPDGDLTGCEKIGEEVTEQLEYRPSRLLVIRFIRPVYATPERDKILTGMLPDRPIERGIPGPGLLAHIIVSKFIDHLPLYRLRQIFKREGISIAASTLDGWVKASADLLEPLYQRMGERIREKTYLQADETPIQVMDASKRGRTHRGYFWVYYSPRDGEVYFDYQRGRGREGPQTMLGTYTGWLQTDGYTVYDDENVSKGVARTHCMAHARRNFEKALRTDERAHAMMKWIQTLYDTEKEAGEEGLSYDERRKIRQEKSVPVLNEMEAWLKAHQYEALPKSDLGKAMAYMLSRWDTLTIFADHGELEIDNNLVENAIRPVALGRKNYLFAGSHEGARRLALFYTLVNNAKSAGLNPETYLRDVLNRIASHPYHKLDDLLPQNIILTK